MPLVSSPLLREWDMLQDQVIPALLDLDGRDVGPTVWSVDSVADAVAVTAAYQHARMGGTNGLRAYASEATRELSPVVFSLADIRCVPAPTRSTTFERQSSRWRPGADIAERVILGRPQDQVDLVTIRAETPDRAAERAIDQLRDGGHLLLIDPTPDISRHRSLRQVGADPRIFRKCTRARTAEPTGPVRADAPADTLARHQVQAELVAGHARLARSLARRFSHHGEAKEDLEQVAMLALLKAARRFDPGRETSFSTYASASILGEIKRHFRDKTWMMRVPRSVQEKYLAVKEAREVLTHELACSPTIRQIGDRLGITDEAVLEAMEAGENYWPESLDVGVFEGETGRDVPVVDGGFELSLERQQFVAVMPRLAPRERLILKRLFFDGWTQRQVAEEVGVSQMQISRLLAQTTAKLRSWVNE